MKLTNYDLLKNTVMDISFCRNAGDTFHTVTTPSFIIPSIRLSIFYSTNNKINVHAIETELGRIYGSNEYLTRYKEYD